MTYAGRVTALPAVRATKIAASGCCCLVAGMSDDAQASATRDLIAALGAMAEVEKSGKAVIESKAGGRRTYRYMELPDLLAAVRTTLAKHNLAVMQHLSSLERDVTVVTVLLHASGTQFRSPELTIRSGGSAQDIGSAATYARRYSLAAFVGLAGSDDDDGRAATITPASDIPTPPRRPDMRAEPKRITDPQLRKMHALFGEIDTAYGRHTDTDARRAVAATYAGRDPDTLATTRDLTVLEAAKVIDALETRLTPIRAGEQTIIGDDT